MHDYMSKDGACSDRNDGISGHEIVFSGEGSEHSHDVLGRTALMQELEQRLLLISTPNRPKPDRANANDVHYRACQDGDSFIPAMVTKCRALEDAVANLKTKNGPQTNRVYKMSTPREYHVVISDLHERLARAEDDEHQLIEEVRVLSRSNAMLRKANEELSKSKQSLEDQIEKLKSRMDSLRRCASAKKNQPVSSSVPVADHTPHLIASLKAQVDAMSQALARQRDQPDKPTECSTCKSIPMLKSRIQELERQDKVMSDELLLVGEKYALLESEQAYEKIELSKARLEIEKLSANNFESARDLELAEQTILSLQSRIEDGNNRTLTITTALRKARKELAEIKQTSTLVHIPKARSESAISIHAQRMDQFAGRRIYELETTNSLYWKKVQRLNNKVLELQTQIREIEKRELTKAPVRIERKRPPPILTEDLDTPQAAPINTEPMPASSQRPLSPPTYRRHFRGLISTTDPDRICVRIDQS